MISVIDAHKRFGQIEAVRGVDFEIPAGQVVGILGPNGAGKTTTIRMITGAVPPTRGAIRVDGLDSISQTLEVRRRLGYLPESAPLYDEMPVESYLRHRASIYGIRGRERKRAIESGIEACQLGSVRRRRIGNLSKGYRQRVGLASVLLHDPKILILDEPTTGLDPAQIAQTRGLIRELGGSRTTLVVSHILPEVERSCDRIILFAAGRVQADGAPESLVRDLPGAGRYTLELKAQRDGVGPAERVLRRVGGVESVEHADLGDGWQRLLVAFEPSSPDRREDLARTCADAGLLIRELRPQLPTLEEVYLRLVAYADEHAAEHRAEASVAAEEGS